MITIAIKPLREAIAGINRLALAQQSTPVLRSVRLKSEKGWLTLTGTDLDQRLTYQTQAEDSDQEECLVPLETLRAAVKGRSTRTKIRIYPGADRHRIQIEERENLSELDCPRIETEGFPEDEPMMKKITVLPAIAIGSIIDALSTASKDETRAILNSVLVEPDAVVSTNGRQLFRSNSLKLDLPSPVVVPAVKTLKVFDPARTAHLFGSVGKRSVLRILQGPWEWTFRPVEGAYPDYRQVFPKPDENRTKIVFSESDISLIRELSRSPAIATKGAMAGLRLYDGKLFLMVGSDEDREVHQLDPAGIENRKDSYVFFDYSFFLLGIGQGMREVSLLDELSSVILEGDHRMNLFMPLRATVSDQEWKNRLVVKEEEPEPEPAETKPTPVPDSDTVAEDPLDVLMGEAVDVRNRLKELAGDLNQLVKGVRRVQRDRSERERDHSALKRTIRSLQRLGV